MKQSGRITWFTIGIFTWSQSGIAQIELPDLYFLKEDPLRSTFSLLNNESMPFAIFTQSAWTQNQEVADLDGEIFVRSVFDSTREERVTYDGYGQVLGKVRRAADTRPEIFLVSNSKSELSAYAERSDFEGTQVVFYDPKYHRQIALLQRPYSKWQEEGDEWKVQFLKLAMTDESIDRWTVASLAMAISREEREIKRSKKRQRHFSQWIGPAVTMSAGLLIYYFRLKTLNERGSPQKLEKAWELKEALQKRLQEEVRDKSDFLLRNRESTQKKKEILGELKAEVQQLEHAKEQAIAYQEKIRTLNSQADEIEKEIESLSNKLREAEVQWSEKWRDKDIKIKRVREEFQRSRENELNPIREEIQSKIEALQIKKIKFNEKHQICRSYHQLPILADEESFYPEDIYED